MAEVTPFTFINAISKTKEDLLAEQPHLQPQYVSFIVNRGLSLFADCILYVNQVNANPHLDSKLQFDYLLNTIRPRTRYSKWPKAVVNQDVIAIQKYFNLSLAKARQAEKVLTRTQLDQIKQKIINQGGVKK